MSKNRLAPPTEERWTRIEQYLGAMARRRTARRARRPGPGTEPASPQLMLSTLPFAALMLVLLAFVIAIAIAAWPPSQPRVDPPKAAEQKHGTAPPGWFDKARKEFR